MGNVDTKLNFRKAIIQLGTKNQVNRSTRSAAIDHNAMCVCVCVLFPPVFFSLFIILSIFVCAESACVLSCRISFIREALWRRWQMVREDVGVNDLNCNLWMHSMTYSEIIARHNMRRYTLHFILSLRFWPCRINLMLYSLRAIFFFFFFFFVASECEWWCILGTILVRSLHTHSGCIRIGASERDTDTAPR